MVQSPQAPHHHPSVVRSFGCVHRGTKKKKVPCAVKCKHGRRFKRDETRGIKQRKPSKGATLKSSWET